MLIALGIAVGVIGLAIFCANWTKLKQAAKEG